MANTTSRARRKKPPSRHGGIILIFGIILVALCASLFMRVETITVSGNSQYSDELIITTSGLTAGGNLVFSKTGGAVRNLTTALPYVKSVKIRRVFPNGLVIAVTERAPLLSFAIDGTYWVAADDLVLLERYTEPQNGLIAVLGETPINPEIGQAFTFDDDRHKSKRDALNAVLNAITRAGLRDRVDSVDIGNLGQIKFVLDGHLTVKLGASTEADRKLALVVDTLKKNNDGANCDEFSVLDDLSGVLVKPKT
ncbi:MAG: FtsQ-type POTRA domain-containing protein [Oscillospiraceae bacterium]|jgi:cell division protein FtsQ|nr:FtsQ-type POTRA domain-containing protein [Oscillospiraceae bacterium]